VEISEEVRPMTTDPRSNGAAPVALSNDPAVLERQVEERRARLAATVDELAVRARPREIARRGAASAKARLRRATTTAEGELRVERIGAVAAGALALLAMAAFRRRMRRR
jgi:hypothetical protein